MIPIAGSCCIRCRTLSLFVSSGGACRRLALSSSYSIAYSMWLRLVACRRWRWWRCSHLVISSSRRAVPSCVSCLLTARLACAVLSHHRHRLNRRFDRRLPALRHGWAGRRADAARCYSSLAACLIPLCLLASGRFSLRLDADGGGGLRSVGSAGDLPACLSRCIRAVLPLVARSFPSIAHSIGAALCRALMS